MNPSEQMSFVRGLLQSVGDKITQDIIDGRIPESWDDKELRLFAGAYLDYWRERLEPRRAFDYVQFVANFKFGG